MTAPDRLRVAWNALRGRPVCYRCVFVSEFELAPGLENAVVIENTIVARDYLGRWAVRTRPPAPWARYWRRFRTAGVFRRPATAREIVERFAPARLNPWHTLTIRPPGSPERWHLTHPIECRLFACDFDARARSWSEPPAPPGVWEWHSVDDPLVEVETERRPGPDPFAYIWDEINDWKSPT